MKKTNETISQLAVSPNRRSGFLSGSFLIASIKNLIQKKSTKIVSIITFIALTASIFMPGQQVRGADFTPSVESYQSTPATLTNNQADYQGTPFTSENYTSVASDDSDYANTTAATSFACGTSTVSRDGITYG
ncbi:MAG: hypothetical protein Q8L10_01285, partial [Candidatus Moranbacteria bacterium]|nr:hypothetical protein [Candidatus Moranbacteria bacterium]